MHKSYMTTVDVAQAFGVGSDTVRKWLQAGKFPRPMLRVLRGQRGRPIYGWDVSTIAHLLPAKKEGA